MPLWLRLAWKECLYHRAFGFFFALNLALGLFGLIAIDTFKTAIQQDLALRSKSILTADLAVTAIRPLKPAEKQQIQAVLPPHVSAETRSLYSMVTAPLSTRLVDIQVIDGRYPLYGSLKLQRRGTVLSDSPKSLLQAPEVWVYPEVLAQLGRKVGESLRIGKQSFVISDVVVQDAGSSGIGFRFAPRVYIGAPWLQATGLVQTGSRISYAQLYRFGADQDGEALAAQLRTRWAENADLRVRTHRDTSEELSRSLNNLNDYLGLVALVALFLASVGAAYLFRSFLLKRSREIAVLLSLGLAPRQIWALYLTQLLLLGSLAALLALGFSLLLLPLLPQLLGDFVPTGLDLSLRPRLFALASVLGLGGSVFFCLPLLGHLQGLRPAALFRENARPSLRLGWRSALAYLPALLLYTLLAVWQSRSLVIGTVVVAAFVVTGLLLGGLAYALLWLLERLFAQAILPLRLAVRTLARQPVASVSSFLAIGLAVLLLTLIPQIRNGMLADLNTSEATAPGLFLFDIQDDQVAPLRRFLQSRAPLQQVYPLVRANLERIKGEPVASQAPRQGFVTREEDVDQAVRTRRYTLSTRPGLLPSEELVAGRPFQGRYNWDAQAPAELSLDSDLAQRLQLKPGDTLDFDLQGVAIQGVVVNLRKVKWTQFEPNFRVLVQPGVLDDAPKTWIGTVPDLPLAEKITLQQDVVRAFPTLALIDVSGLIRQVVGILQQIAAILQGMALIVLLAGFSVLYAIAAYQARERRPDIALLKTLGARFGLIRQIIALEFALLTGLAASSGVLAGLGTSWILTRWVFEGSWVFAPLLPLGLIVGSSALGVIVGLLSTSRVLATPPQSLLE
ncbi:MAG: ABC transporter permease [Candidatus Sericytochromatia bacterium]